MFFKKRKPRLIVDINLLPKEYKENLQNYEKDFNVKVIPLDLSQENTRGAQPMFEFHK